MIHTTLAPYTPVVYRKTLTLHMPKRHRKASKTQHLGASHAATPYVVLLHALSSQFYRFARLSLAGALVEVSEEP